MPMFAHRAARPAVRLFAHTGVQCVALGVRTSVEEEDKTDYEFSDRHSDAATQCHTAPTATGTVTSAATIDASAATAAAATC